MAVLKDEWGLELGFRLQGLCQQWSHPLWLACYWLKCGPGVMKSHVGSACFFPVYDMISKIALSSIMLFIPKKSPLVKLWTFRTKSLLWHTHW